MPVLLFVVLPLVELWLLIQVGAAIGALPTLLLVIGAGLLGLAVLNRQGFRTLTRVRARMARGEPPAAEMLDGLLIAIGGLLLLMPGLLSDAVGVLLLLPPLRHWLAARLLGPMSRRQRRESGAGELIEGDYRRENGRRENGRRENGRRENGRRED